MSLVLDILRIVAPVAIIGVIALFVIMRMKNKYHKGTLGKKETQSEQIILDSLIPFGMMFGVTIAILISFYSPLSLLSAITWGSGIGLLLGYLAYEIYSIKA